MTFASSIRRCPIAFDPDAGAEVRVSFADQPPEVKDLLAGAAGCSPYLRGLVAKERGWLEPTLAQAPAPDELVVNITSHLTESTPKELPAALRQGKRRLALYAGLADLGGVWSLAEVTQALTDFADRSVAIGLRSLLAPELARGKLPGQGPDDLDEAAGLVVLAMGKMGAAELNYSSDIDLICVFDDSRYPGVEAGVARAGFVRVVRRLMALLSDQTGDGYVWRTDLRLRPDPSVTPVVVAMEAAERYYESLGRTWERAAHIKARPCAGAITAGAAYLDRLRPFVWRRHLDFAAVEDTYQMQRKIREHKGLHDAIALEGRDLKLGPGGIREVEFFCQTKQLIAGGRDPDLRVRGTVAALDMLAQKDWIPPSVADALTGHYRVLRELEHRVQMVADARTHALPSSLEGMDRIARMCGEGDTARFRKQVSDCLRAVSAETEALFPGHRAPMPGPAPEDEPDIVRGWLRYPALRTERARACLERLKPDLLSRLAAAARPDEALTAFDGFLSGLPAGVQLFAMFEANPQLRALIVDIAATSPALARYLSRHSSVLDAVIGGDFFAPWPGRPALTELLEAALTAAVDYEARLDTARRFAREWHFRIGVHHLRGLIDADAAGAHYADLAEAVLRALFPWVCEQVADRHGATPGAGAAVIGMGSLGGGWLNARSDLDLLLVYDAPGDAVSDGRRPLPARAYYARLTQALVTALSAATAEGNLYEVDMRLRPSGRQGPVATSLASFAAYQREEAWTWEHLALTRARPVAGADAVGEAVERVRAEVLRAPRDGAKVRADVAEMRARLAAAKAPAGPLDVKAGAGGMRELELLGQMAALLTGDEVRGVAEQVTAAAASLGCDSDGALAEAFALQRRVLAATRLLLDTNSPGMDDLAEGARAMLLRETGMPDLDTLLERLETVRREADAIALSVLA